MSTTANKALVEKAIGILSGQTPEDFAQEAFAADYRDHNAPGDGGPARFLKVRAQLQTAFSDLKHEILASVAEDDIVSIHVQLTGTHTGVFQAGPRAIPATGNAVVIRSMHMLRVADGRITDNWAVRDDLTVLRAVGALPTPPAGGPGGPGGPGGAGGPAGPGGPGRPGAPAAA
ncbi:protein of unknown function DUF1486 [Catenulispora acidiphila DSM 44928]|uniref:Ester cyclase n=1 Tax=Catenulispora acidiphila (strain DSM 44928 / JCM 14897 / NBRC 102108 / NRRL B-24433 / ID139908) TaxID=479433 RepID=C7QAG6_CATAD|nr:ester cyclase [Catenulispora acidiphila]ACU72465.1 protein of unknown function DUF1486 [Catenulispora acidiphila DSM 44928]